MKKIFLSFALLLSLIGLGACRSSQTQEGSSKPRVAVTTSFLNDMVYQLAGDEVERDLLIPAGEDPHLYVAKSSDLSKLQKANLVLYHGLHFEGKMVEALEKSGVAVSKNFDEEDLNTMDEDGEKIVDPHFWFSIPLYKSAVAVASEELQKLVPKKADLIKKNTEKYLAQLDDLHKWIEKELSVIPADRRYLVTPHDAFNYFASSYGFTLFAPQGVSTDSEVANSDMIETVNLIIKHKIKAIFTESTTNPERMKKLQEAVKAKGGQVEVVSGEGKELFSDSLAPEGEAGDTFIDMYKHNIKLIVEHLK
ncbi:metal ABC transporter solute-binding protein, Zn/Mn family [Streptococcus ruminantium]|uniref:Zinc ABC transporter substrate-binding protein n=1 Tax=Streptococcus ruminantium TaxID=1917441 RepID=A0ABU1B2R0_9STRE|nr:zinc ABC transporter substrate-binding protein [Streptococcus ruminantium]MDQ8759117.1 zinc ABC transporter substrate-binding protein [Streptococcus ruminantium]MDQ8765649.1 zinc ABC transporter substrate-binding protein [Streptococcus ruminantium]MDQ8767197.1 zinc ABC transporter substrate-binding protein [Streptococcus ruminantium]MDQ8769536.1 zinc ABC transporter substrate-binding protein [Streptococcus ruminantium]MDQ8775426.1 zinc ABC transporter substrate-binding protein [Streptococcu